MELLDTEQTVHELPHLFIYVTYGLSSHSLPLSSFEDSFQITGWNIGKHNNYDFVVMGTPDSPNNDRDLFQMVFGLSNTFMSNQNPDLDEVALRFGNNNTDPVLTWGVPAADVELYRPSPAPGHPDGAIFDMTREIPRFLNPIVAFLRSIPDMCQDERSNNYVNEHFVSKEKLKLTVLADYFKHGFDGSGDDGGSCM